MGAPGHMTKLTRGYRVTLNDTLTSGITKSDPSKRISEILSFVAFDDGLCKLYLRVNNLKKNIASDADLGFGEKIFSYPSGLGLVLPMFTHLNITGSAPTGLSATAGEIGLGTTIASGAVAVLTGTAGFHSVMEAQTIANHVAATPLAIKEAAFQDAPFAGGQTAPVDVQNAVSSAVDVHLNVASAWNQTAAEDYTFGGTIVHWFRVAGSDYGVE